MKKNATHYDEAVKQLNAMFGLFNKEYFENKLSKPTITIQSTPRVFGHFSLDPNMWISSDGNTHEINIGAGTLNRPIAEVAATLLHEMVHYHNYINGIKDCSRGGTYHNKRFKEAAEARGLRLTRTDKYGWSFTEPTDELIALIKKHNFMDIDIYRNEVINLERVSGGKKSNRGQRKKHEENCMHECPCCGLSFPAPKIADLKCMKCDEVLIKS